MFLWLVYWQQYQPSDAAPVSPDALVQSYFQFCHFHTGSSLLPPSYPKAPHPSTSRTAQSQQGTTQELRIKIPAVLQRRWLAAAAAPGAILHQSPKTVCLQLCMNVRSPRARSLERLWWNPVIQFWHLISIKHEERCSSADWRDWKDSGACKLFYVWRGMLYLCEGTWSLHCKQ